jgi:AraC-like DNA-binding protein
MKLYIKSMVSLRCKMHVKEELNKLGIDYESVELGMAKLDGNFTREKKERLEERLKALGLEITDDEKDVLVERIIHVIDDMIHHSDSSPEKDIADCLSEMLGHDYSYLSKLFSEVNGMDIQQYITKQKVEAVKELLLYDELSLEEIAKTLNYSSTDQLSSQFKEVTGMTPAYFKLLEIRKV